MTYGEAKDIVRINIGKLDIEPTLLNYILASGRREIEKDNSWYYMRRRLEFNLEVDIQAYAIGSGLAINEANFKNARVVMFRESGGTVWSSIQSGDRGPLDLRYTTDSEGAPQHYTINDEDGQLKMLLYPVKPDEAYVMRMLYYVWTENPKSDTGTDELLSRWPELLIYASSAQGLRMLTKDEGLAQPWNALMQAELLKLKRYDWFRHEEDKAMMFPGRGPYENQSRNTSQDRWE